MVLRPLADPLPALSRAAVLSAGRAHTNPALYTCHPVQQCTVYDCTVQYTAIPGKEQHRTVHLFTAHSAALDQAFQRLWLDHYSLRHPYRERLAVSLFIKPEFDELHNATPHKSVLYST